MKTMPHLAQRAASLAVALALCGGAHGADKARSAPPAKSGDRVLTPAQLRDCLAQKEQLRGQTDSALKAKAELAAEKAEIDRTAAALEAAVATLDRTSADAVAVHNARVDERSALIDAYQAKVGPYNSRAEALQATRESYEKACENRRYDERDLNDLQRKK